LGEVRFPNHSGINCTFITDALSLSPKNSQLGLPNFVQSFFRNVPDLQFNVNINDIDTPDYIFSSSSVHGELNLEGLPIHSTIQLFDMMGRSMLTITTNDTSATINTHSLAKGHYIVRVLSVKGVVTKKVVVW